MDIQILGKDSLKIKSKKATLAVDPGSSIQKLDADAILSTNSLHDLSRVTDYRVLFDGPGEFEVSGLKISGIKSAGGVIFGLSSDTFSILIARASSLSDVSVDKLGEYKIIVINADADLNQSAITAMEPRVIVLYGDKKEEGAKLLGKEKSNSNQKITVLENKLPEELEIELLG